MSLLSIKHFSLRIRVLIFVVFTILSATTLVAIGLGYWQRQEYLDKFTQNLETVSQLHEKNLRQRIDVLRRDARVLSRSASVQAAIRMVNEGGSQALRGESGEILAPHWLDSLVLFTESHPEYTQISLIEAKDNGRELLRIDRKDERIQVASFEHLQSHSASDYFQATQNLKPGEVYLSEIRFNPAYFKTASPDSPSLRAITPIFMPDGRLLGMLAMRMNIQATLDIANITAQPCLHSLQVATYIVSDKDFWPVHPDRNHVLSSLNLGLGASPERLQQKFFFPGMHDDGAKIVHPPLRRLNAADGKLYAVLNKIYYDSAHSNRYLVFLYILPEQALNEQMRPLFKSIALTSFLIGLQLLFLVLWILYRQLSPLRNLTRAAKAIAAGNYDIRLPEAWDSELNSLVQSFRNLKQEVRKRELSLRLSEQSANRIIDGVPYGVLVTDINGTIQRVNSSLEKMFGISAEALIGAKTEVLIDQPIEDLLQAQFGQADHVIDNRIELFGRRPDGGQFPIEVRLVSMEPIGVKLASQERRYQTRLLMTIVDVSARQTLERERDEYRAHLEETVAELREHRDHLEDLVTMATAELKAIVETAVSGIVTIDAKSRIRIFNPAAEKLFGWRLEEIVGRNVSILMEEDTGAQHDTYLANYLRTGESKTIGFCREITARRKDGGTFHAHLSIGHARLNDDKHFFAGFFNDITEQKQHEEELKQARDAAEAGAQIKAAFIANMSHEIRTPMNAIIGFAQLLIEDNSLQASSRKYSETILTSAKSLLGIINDILDVSKLESGKFSLENVGFNLHSTLQMAFEVISCYAAEKNLQLYLNYDTNLPERFIGDPTRLRQVFLNLLGNAIKFTERGSISMTVRPGNHRDMLLFCLQDTGIGMTDEQMAMIFHPFVQADESTTRNFGGTGLGTAISKQIVELMGGEIWVESQLGKGSAFYFTACLPTAEDAGDCLYECASKTTAGVVSPRLFNVLLAEDLETNAALVIHRLQQMGHTVRWVKNGREVVKESQSHDYDIILMDVMMPKQDGHSATREIRERERETGGHVRILALTACLMTEDYAQCFDSGMDGVEGKPIDFDQLFTSMEAIVPAGRGKPRPAQLDSEPVTALLDLSVLEGFMDYRKALDNWHDSAALASMLMNFREDHLQDASKIERLLLSNPGDPAAAKSVTHALTGVAGNLSLTQVAGVAREIDQCLKTGEVDAAMARLSILQANLTALGEALARLDFSSIGSGQVSVKPFDQAVVQKLLGGLIVALNAFNPKVAQPYLDELSVYLAAHDLAPIQKEVQAYEFDEAKVKVEMLAHNMRIDLK